MSKTYDDVEISLAFNEGHNDAWDQKRPKPAPAGDCADQLHQSYRRGYAAGTTARYWYDKGRDSVHLH